MSDMWTGFLITHTPWAGSSARTEVEILAETPKRYRIRAIGRTSLAGRSRCLEPGQEALVPKHAVRDHCARCRGKQGGTPGNENIIDGVVTCDYCHAALMRDRETKASAICLGCGEPIGDHREHGIASRTLRSGAVISAPSHRSCAGRSGEILMERENGIAS